MVEVQRGIPNIKVGDEIIVGTYADPFEVAAREVERMVGRTGLKIFVR